MEWIHATIQDFGRNMGIDDLRMAPGETLSMNIEGQGDLFLELAGQDVLIYLARTKNNLGSQAITRALELCHFRENNPHPVHAALHGDDTLIFLTRVPGQDFTLPALTNNLTRLARLHDIVGQIREN